MTGVGRIADVAVGIRAQMAAFAGNEGRHPICFPHYAEPVDALCQIGIPVFPKAAGWGPLVFTIDI